MANLVVVVNSDGTVRSVISNDVMVEALVLYTDDLSRAGDQPAESYKELKNYDICRFPVTVDPEYVNRIWTEFEG